MRSPRRCRANPLPNRPPLQEPREQGDRRDQRPAPLPGADLDLRAGVAVDLPGEVIDSAGEGRARLDEAKDGECLALAAAPAPGPRDRSEPCDRFQAAGGEDCVAEA